MLYFVKEIGVDLVMILFKYTCINLGINNDEQVAGFEIELGEEWNDLAVYEVNRNGKIINSNHKTIVFNKDWLNNFLKFIVEQKEIKNLSSWIYKLGNHSTEHRFVIEGTGWNKEITLYNLGVLKNYEYQSYKDEEIVLLEFFDKVIELFAEHNIELSYTSIRV